MRPTTTPPAAPARSDDRASLSTRSGLPGRPGESLAPGAPVEAPVPAVSPEEIEALRAILDRVREKRPALGSTLEHASPLRVAADKVELAYEAGSFLVPQATEPAALEALTAAAREHFGSDTTEVRFELTPSRPRGATLAQLDTADRRARVDAARRAVAEHPLVTAAVELLGAELRDVRLAQDEA